MVFSNTNRKVAILILYNTNFSKMYFAFSSVSVCVSVCGHVCVGAGAHRGQKGHRVPETGVTGSCEPPDVCISN